MFLTTPDVSIRAMVEGMKPWMAFFSIYSRFVQNNGWKYSVDMEAFHLAKKMGKDIIPLETIEEQIEVLETVSRPQIVDFLKRIDQWKSYTSDFVKWYLDGDLEKIHFNSYRFPTRSPLVIEDRDRVFYERMLSYLEQGDAAAFVGIPHVMRHQSSALRRWVSDSEDARLRERVWRSVFHSYNCCYRWSGQER